MLLESLKMLGQTILISLSKTNMSFLFGNKRKKYQTDWLFYVFQLSVLRA